MYKHLIFDLDGTIIDTMSSIISALNIVLKKFNKPYRYTLKQGKDLIGFGIVYLIKKAFKDDNVDVDKVLKVFVPLQIKMHEKKAKIYSGLVSTFKTLRKKGYTFYIATNKPKEVGEKVVKKLYGDEFFKEAIYQEKNTPKKPDPFIINKIIKDNKINRKEVLYIGDGQVDIDSARNAKIDCCLVRYGYGKYELIKDNYPKYKIDKPRELLDILK